ncbi:MAG: LacI family transcriptional regulator [Clostridiaceae bacterium]|nr:LacI family transcriptional regulator [Clostridiaceae bacterium]
MVKISDIAKKANVSITTVSRALNDYPDIKQKTKEKVLTIAKEMGYFPNANAKGLKTKNNWLVGILFTESLNVGLEHPLYAGVIESFKSTISKLGYDTIFITSSIGKRKTSYLNHCIYRNVSGVFVCTYTGLDKMLKELMESNIKCVTTDVDYSPNVPIILSDNVNGMIQAYDYLYEMGHRNIAFLSGPLNTLSGRERFIGYQTALTNKSQIYKPHYIAYANDYDFNSGMDAANVLLTKCSHDMPTALLVGGDMLAIGAMTALENRGLKIPDDISVIGFDDIEMAKYIKPGLTTVRQDRKLLGKEIANTLVAYINGDDVPPRTLIPVSVIKRGTCAPPRT